MDTPGVIIPKIRNETEDGLKLCAVNAIRDGILEQEYICDYILYRLNKESLFAYVNRYSCPMRKPIDKIDELVHVIMDRFKFSDRNAASDALLKDFREGRLG